MLVSCLLAACSNAPTNAVRWSVPAGERAPVAAQGLPSGLQIRVTGAPWINQTGFLYSLDYRAPGTFDNYAHNQWVDRPPVLVEDLMRRAYAAAQATPSGSASAGGGAAAQVAALSVRLVEFAQHYRSQNESEARVAAVVTVSEVNPGRVRSAMFQASASAPSADAAGGAEAMAQASDRLIEQIFAWAAAR